MEQNEHKEMAFIVTDDEEEDNKDQKGKPKVDQDEEEEEVQTIEPEKEGPVEFWLQAHPDEYAYEHFYLGLKKYQYDLVPDPIGTKPEEPEHEDSGWQFYEKTIEYHQKFRKYMDDLTVWKRTNRERIQGLSRDELKIGKCKYRENERNKNNNKKRKGKRDCISCDQLIQKYRPLFHR